MVVFGTGKFLEPVDVVVPSTPDASQPVNSFYAVRDSYTKDWDGITPSELASKRDRTPISDGRDALQQQTITAVINDDNGQPSKRLTSDTDVDYGKKSGWYLDLLEGNSLSNFNGERQVSGSSIRFNKVLFTTNIPSDETCLGGGNSWLMEMNVFKGSSWFNKDVNNASELTAAQKEQITNRRIGGIAGYNDNGGVISYSDNNGAVTGKGNYSAAGGIVGYNNGSIKNSFNNGNVTGYGDYLGGIVGENIKDIFDSYNKGEIKGKGYDTVTGGITGINDSGNINNVYNSGIVDSMGYNVGGIVGQNYSGTLNNAYNTGTINGNGSEYVGGIAAINDGEIKNVYNIGKVSGGDYRNVIVVENSGAVSNAYYAVRSGDTILGYKKFGSRIRNRY